MSYTKDGVQYPSVTTILGMLDKPALLPWASRCAVDHIRENLDRIQKPHGPHEVDGILNDAVNAFRNISGAAKDVGHAVHTAIENYVRGGLDLVGDLPPEVENGFLAFLEWESLNDVEWVDSELTLISTIRGYAGTTDAIARINGALYVLDYKTSTGVYDEMRMQLAAYLQAYREREDALPVERVAILRLDKQTGAPEFTDVTTGLERHRRTFNLMIPLYYAMKKRRLKNNPFVAEYWS